MPKKIALISRDNGVGLSLDVKLLTDLFESAGHEVAFYDWQARQMPRVDVAIHLELIGRELARCADRNIGILNLEWFPTEWLRWLPAFDQIWAKSAFAYQFCRMRGGRDVRLMGFLGRDMYDPNIPRKPTVLHLRGRSSMKGTEQVVEAWSKNPDLPSLTIVSKDPVHAPDYVDIVHNPSDAELSKIINECRIHVCPSIAEGWGHYITEGMSVGATIVTTDASPMNEHIRPEWGYLLKVTHEGKHHQARQTFTSADFIAEAVRRAVDLGSEGRDRVGSQARMHFIKRNDFFRREALRLIGS